MTRLEVVNDKKFKSKCYELGLYWENCDVFSDFIILYTPINDLYVLLDKNYNTIGVETIEIYALLEILSEYFAKYKKSNNEFSYPFENYSLKQLIDLSNRISIKETNHGNSLITKVNGQIIQRTKENEDTIMMLSYVKFLGEEIKSFFNTRYEMQMMGFDSPDIYTYVNRLIDRLDMTVRFHLSKNNRPWPTHIVSALGKNYNTYDLTNLLYDISDLLMSKEGYKLKSGSPEELIKIESKDLSSTANNLLELLNVTDKEIEKIEKNERDRIVQKQLQDFQGWLEEDIDEDEEVEVIYCDRAFAVSPESSTRFLNQQPNPESQEEKQRILKIAHEIIGNK